ncbi:RAN GTPase-activating protein [Chloropicon primus]|uniref:RAN GTPase-activating protein n=1 Tax=Chloropicon primus TaxID=1764295 RepID=A0A5B8MQZ3_9CHLO|nr:RAN GTPase-activating protein [Chloropicon primus]|mmetsp:Transcript_7593/g.21751  ORF Transcript_7593/g.21751 Transcript_7593/m.21751 type:complete len:521 (+) Transcript_7593:73-1635(+)|eukprot:QDZ21800.1 RAN GTPase-activating protein [Chloropicon primus]
MEEWEVKELGRKSVREGVAHSIRSLAELKGVKIEEEKALAKAKVVEEKAYTAAKVDSRTTTGRRPDEETTQIYARKAGNLVVQAVEAIERGEDAGGKGQAGAEDYLDLCDGNREFVTAETAKELFGPILSASKSGVRRIRLSTKSFGVDAAAVAAEAFSTCRDTLVDLDLSDVIAGRPEDEAMKSLKCLCDAVEGLELESLDLSDNALGEKGIRACATALTSQKSLRGIAFRNIGCSVAACKAIHDLLACRGTLKRLHLYNNMSDNEGAFSIAKLIQETPCMEDFMMVSSRVKQEGGQRLAGALMGKNLVSLDLHDNILGPETAGALVGVLQTQQHLKHLNLSEACLEDEGVELVAGALMNSAPKLESVGLAANDITADACPSLVRSLAGKQNLREIDLKENELGDRGACLLSSILAPKAGLETLDLYQNEIGRAGAVAVVKSILACKNLKKLDLNANYIPGDCVDEIVGVMKHAFPEGSILSEFDENEEDMGDDDTDPQELQAYTQSFVDELASSFSNL